MPSPEVAVLYEDNHLLVVDKPAGLATIGVAESQPSLAKLAQAYIKRRYSKPGNVYLGVMSRLDAAVSGVVVLARTSKAAARLTEQFRTREVAKTYLAMVAGRIEPPAGECVDWLLKDDARARMVIASPSARGPKKPGSAIACCGDLARLRHWKWNFRPVASIKYGCSWPGAAARSSAIGSMGVRPAFRRASRCMRGELSYSIRYATNAWSLRPPCRRVGLNGGESARFLFRQKRPLRRSADVH